MRVMAVASRLAGFGGAAAGFAAGALCALAYHADVSVADTAWWDTRRLALAAVAAVVAVAVLASARQAQRHSAFWLLTLVGVLLSAAAGAYTAAANHPLTGPDLPLMNAEQTWDPDTLRIAALLAAAAVGTLLAGAVLGGRPDTRHGLPVSRTARVSRRRSR
jgi:hypothetical protein